MTVGYTTTKDIFTRNSGMSSQSSTYGLTPDVSNYWTRPSEWLTLPTLTGTEQQIVGLVAVTDTDSNFIALNIQVSSGTYTVDWGDGTVETIASNTQANHQYNYSTISSTLTSEGWKQVIVQVYPTTTGQTITVANLNLKYANSSVIVGTLNNYTAGWLDVAMSVPNCTNLSVGNGGSSQSYLQRCQQFALYSVGGPTLSNFNLGGLSDLQSVPILNFGNVTSGFNMQTMFYGCVKLKVAPKIDWSKCTNTFQMFFNCYSLVYVPDATTPMSTNWTGVGSVTRLMFQNCTSLVRAPWLDTSKSSSMQSMFNGCTSLEYVPYYDYTTCTDLSSMFNACSSLQTAPKFNNLTTAMTVTTSMFAGCSSLSRAPDINTINVTSTQTMFQNCFALEYVPTYNTSNATAMASMFSSCNSLNTAPVIDTTKATNVGSIYSSFSIDTLPALNVANATTIGTLVNTGNNLSKVNYYGMKVSYSVIGQAMSKNALETMFNNSTGNATSQTVTITNNWGADTAVTVAGGTWSLNGYTITYGSAPPATVTAGKVVYGTNISGVFTTISSGNWNTAADTITVSAPILTGTALSFNTTANGVTQYKTYYTLGLAGANATVFQISETPGGSPVDITGNTAIGMQWEKKVVSVVGSVVTLNNPLQAAGSAA
jgi:hypothetical protein